MTQNQKKWVLLFYIWREEITKQVHVYIYIVILQVHLGFRCMSNVDCEKRLL